MIWSYAGVRALYDDGEPEAKNVTRDYRLELDDTPGPKLLSVFGGKITTARHLAGEALDKLGVGGFKFTRTQPLPGGDIDIAFNAALIPLALWMPDELRRPPRPRLRHPARDPRRQRRPPARPGPPFRRRPVRSARSAT